MSHERPDRGGSPPPPDQADAPTDADARGAGREGQGPGDLPPTPQPEPARPEGEVAPPDPVAVDAPASADAHGAKQVGEERAKPWRIPIQYVGDSADPEDGLEPGEPVPADPPGAPPDQPVRFRFENLSGGQEWFDARHLEPTRRERRGPRRRPARRERRGPRPEGLDGGGQPEPDPAAIPIYGGKYPPHQDKVLYALPGGRWVLGSVVGLEGEGALGGSLSATDIEVTPEFACAFLGDNDHPLPQELIALADHLGDDPYKCPMVGRFYDPTSCPEPTPAPPSPEAPIHEPPSKKGVSKQVAIVELLHRHPNLSNAEIARRVGCHPGTVSRHLSSVRQAMGESARQAYKARQDQKGKDERQRGNYKPRRDDDD